MTTDKHRYPEEPKAIEVLRKFVRCPLGYEHRGAPPDDPRRLRWDCRDEQCTNPACIRYTQCTNPHHDAADLIAEWDAEHG